MSQTDLELLAIFLTQPPSDGIIGMNLHAGKKLHLFICFEIGFHMGFTKRIISLETAFILYSCNLLCFKVFDFFL